MKETNETYYWLELLQGSEFISKDAFSRLSPPCNELRVLLVKSINTAKQDAALTVALEGRLDTTTAPELEKALTEALDGVEALTIDLEKLEYISSAGLRVLLSAQKRMMKQGEMKVIHVNDAIMEIFEVTGFSDILTIE